jgi:hypothetical protein
LPVPVPANEDRPATRFALEPSGRLRKYARESGNAKEKEAAGTCEKPTPRDDASLPRQCLHNGLLYWSARNTTSLTLWFKAKANNL